MTLVCLSEAMASSLPALLLVLCSLCVAQAFVRVYNLRASGLDADLTTGTDCYVKLYCDSKSMGMTSIQMNTDTPWWDDEFAYHAAVHGSVLKLSAFDKDVTYDDALGSCQYTLREGTYSHTCRLVKGTLRFSYTLS